MSEQIKTATFVRSLAGFTGDARLYMVSPAAEQRDWDGALEATHDYVIVSATTVPFSGPETYIFPATPDGEVADWGELDGSYRGGLDHEEALRNAGYVVGGDVLVVAESPRKGVEA